VKIINLTACPLARLILCSAALILNNGRYFATEFSRLPSTGLLVLTAPSLAVSNRIRFVAVQKKCQKFQNCLDLSKSAH
jgi:hypothetical protein